MIKYLFAFILGVTVTTAQAQLLEPTAENLALATKIGAQNKETLKLEATYTLARKQNMEVELKTPLYIAAKHAKDKAQDYLEPDKDFIKYLETMKHVQLECEIMGLGGFTDPNFPRPLKVILLRDGVRVTNATAIPSFNGKNPFTITRSTATVKNQMAIVEKQAALTTQMLLAQLNQEQKEQFVKSQFNAGKSAKEIAKMVGWKEEDVLKLKPAEEVKPEIFFTPDDGVYALEELQKPGKYEAIIRQGAIGFDSAIFGSKDSSREYRIAIKFDVDAKLLKLLKK